MTTLGANVSLIEHSIVYGQTLEDYTIQVDYALPLTYRAAQIPSLGDSYPGDTAPWGYIVVGHDSFKTLERGGGNLRERYDLKLIDTRTVALGPYVTRVMYAKPKIPYDSGITGLKEVARRLDTGRLGRRTGLRVFLAAEADADSIADASLPELTPMFAAGNWQYALLREKQIEHRWRVGITKITAVYDTYAPIGEVIYVNKGILEADSVAVMMWNRDAVPGTGTPGKRIDQIYWDLDVRKQWVRVKGNNGWPLVRADYRIRAVLTTSNLATVNSLVGKVNSNACPNIVDAAAETLWFNKFSMRQRKRGEGNLFDCLIYLAHEPDGWDSATLAQLQEYVIREQKVKDNAGAEIAGARHRTGSWTAVAGDPTKMPIENTASFSILNSYLS